jgi:hypothetical protein
MSQDDEFLDAQRAAPVRPNEGTSRSSDEEEGDATLGLIPYKNAPALLGYYVGIFSLIPCIGLVLGPMGLILGIMGLRHRSLHPKSRGTLHALVGIVLGSLTLIVHLAVITVLVLAASQSSIRGR